jgi:hypothetical protein
MDEENKNIFFCPNCGSNGEHSIGMFIDDCPNCESYQNWAKVIRETPYDSPYIACICKGGDDSIIWGEYHKDVYFFIRLAKNFLPVPTYLYDISNLKIVDPITKEFLGYFNE